MKILTAKILTALAVALAVAVVGTADANAYSKKRKGYDHYSYASKRMKPQVRGYISRGGGYANGYEYESFLSKNRGGYGNSPYFDDRNFWERVQSSPMDSRPGVSAY